MSAIKYSVSFLMGVYVGTYFDCKPQLHIFSFKTLIVVVSRYKKIRIMFIN